MATSPIKTTPEEIGFLRDKISARTEPCSPECAGWAVFNSQSDPSLQRCDDCWDGDDYPLMDDEVELLPEAQHELALARAAIERDESEYEPPAVRAPCTCGCIVFHVSYHHETCCGCDQSRPRTVQTTELHPSVTKLDMRDNHIFVKALAAMDSAEEINGPEGDDYVRLMRAIEDEARSRRETYESERVKR